MPKRVIGVAQKIVGHTGGWPRRWGRTAIIAAGLLAATTMLVTLSALPTSEFELEGNAVVDSPPSDDWANTVPTVLAGSEAKTSVFIADGSGNATIFTGGGSKDINDISQWKWKDELGGLPDKDNITNAYAAAYITGSDLTIYFGADRFATAGDAQLGFWFFHRRIQAVNGIFVEDDGVTPATHTLGDILVLANFSNGGSTVTAQVFQWNGSGLTQVANSTNSKCGVNDNPNVCAITNEGDAVAPWSYVPKAGTPGTFPQVSFFEGGINISAFIQTAAGACFSSFLAETRSSTSENATLKDFALGEFNTCKLDIAKSCDTPVTYDPVTNLLTYTSSITVTNSGFGTLHDVTIVDTPTAPAAPQTFVIPTLAAGASQTVQHAFTYTPSLSTPNPPSNTASATAAVNPGGLQIVDAGSDTATCPQVQFDAALTITKACTSAIEVLNDKLVVAINVSGTVCNIPQAPAFPEAINGVVVSDTPPFAAGNINLGTLASGDCVNYTAKYYPSLLTLVDGNPSSNPGDQVFTDTAAVTGTGAITGNARANTMSATCPLCPPCVGSACSPQQ
jgi:hypothetical protein